MTTRLITIPFSHFCEKARWALDRAGVTYTETCHLPLFAMLPARLAGGRHTVPCLVDGRTSIPDSTEILAWADARSPGCLLPADPVDRAAALQLEDDFDEVFGPATRRWMYYHITPRRDLESRLLQGAPRWQRFALSVFRPLAMLILRRRIKLEPVAVERSAKRIDATLERISALLADGRRFLVGNRFSVADLTFAALSAPVLLPRAYTTPLPSITDFTGEPRARLEAWHATPAAKFALRIYETERAPARRAA